MMYSNFVAESAYYHRVKNIGQYEYGTKKFFQGLTTCTTPLLHILYSIQISHRTTIPRITFLSCYICTSRTPPLTILLPYLLTLRV